MYPQLMTVTESGAFLQMGLGAVRIDRETWLLRRLSVLCTTVRIKWQFQSGDDFEVVENRFGDGLMCDWKERMKSRMIPRPEP